MHTPSQLLDLFEEELKQLRFEGEPGNLYEPFGYLLALGGKRTRPVLLLMAAELFGGRPQDALSQAFAIELFHNFTLIHDDIMDHAPLRRGQATVHKQFGEATAILSGDAMLVTAWQFLTKGREAQALRLMKLFNDCAIHVCEGQQLDMNFEEDQTVSVPDYLAMIEKKTAVLIATALQIGAICGGASEADAQHLYDFGKELGIAFQLKDDWLDAFGDTSLTGKQPGGDIMRNKKTFLQINALDLATESQRLLIFQPAESGTDAEKVKAVTALYKELGTDMLTQNEIESHYSKAINHLEAVTTAPATKKPLLELAAALMSRIR